jgi:D-alanyl-D-alanine carboxypeptidase
LRALTLLCALSLAMISCSPSKASDMRVETIAVVSHSTARLPVRELATSPALTARAAMLYDVTSGKTLLAVNANAQLPMASTTKIMTAVVALTFGRLDQPVAVGADAVALDNQGASLCGLIAGDTLTLREMLYCLMLPSGDDAAVAIADSVGGSQAGFVALMNLEARLLGLAHTHYANPHGLDQAGHYSSANDLIRLAAYAMSSPTFARIVATPKMTIPATASHHRYVLTNTNELLAGEPFAYPGAIGVKTGYTGGAGYCLVFAAKRSQGTLLGVVLGEPYLNDRFTDPTALLTWGFAQLSTPGAATASSAS